MRKVIYIGDRTTVYRRLVQFAELEVVAVLARQDSNLHSALVEEQREHRAFSLSEKQDIVNFVASANFDILLSNGCPFILPISRLRKPHQLFLNVHPSVLPDGRGCHPINAVLLMGQRFVGATMHYMDDGVDTGRIVCQESVEVTSDLDLGLLYQIAFELEGQVFATGIGKLIDAGYALPGDPQPQGGSYYTRKPADQRVDFGSMSDGEILLRVKAFGVMTQGVTAQVSSGAIRIFEATQITNRYLLEKYGGQAPRTLLMQYQECLLVKSRDGIIKISSHHPLESANGNARSSPK